MKTLLITLAIATIIKHTTAQNQVFFVEEKTDKITISFLQLKDTSRYKYRIYYSSWQMCPLQKGYSYDPTKKIPSTTLTFPTKEYRPIVCWSPYTPKNIYIYWICEHLYENWKCEYDIIENRAENCKGPYEKWLFN